LPKPQTARQDLRIEPLGKAHEKATFFCGVPVLDRYFATQASQDVSKRVAACFVATPDGSTVAGFYTLSQYSVDLVELPRVIAVKLPRYPEVPATLLGRLAVNQAFRGQGIGEFLTEQGNRFRRRHR
jgi:GNAT superfamily N-acetyltransferase